MKIVIKLCKKCLIPYPTIFHKCPKCGCYDYETIKKEVKHVQKDLNPNVQKLRKDGQV